MPRFTILVFPFLLLLTFFTFQTLAQIPPNGINYQAVVRDVSGSELTNTAVVFRFTIRTGSTSGTLIYQETQNTVTNSYGLVFLVIGQGTQTIASPGNSLSQLNWLSNSTFVNVEIAIGASPFTSMGSSQYLTTPYSFVSGTAISVSGGNVNAANLDIVNGIRFESMNKNGAVLTVDGTGRVGAGYITGTTYTAGSGISITGSNQIINTGGNINLSGLGTTILGSGTSNPTVVGQKLVAGSNITITGNTINAAAPAGLTAGSNVTISGNTISALGSQWQNNGQSIYYNISFVGIGTSLPAARLDVNGNSIFRDSVVIGTTPYSVTPPQVHIYTNPTSAILVEDLRLTGGGCSTGGGPMMTFQNACDGSTNTQYQDWITAAIGSPYAGSYQGDLTFYTNDGVSTGYTSGSIGNSTFERMRITSQGNVGIGNPIPFYKLDVNGDLNVNLNTSVYRINSLEVLRKNANGSIMVGGAGNATTTAYNSVFVGQGSGYVNSTGNYNVFTGYESGYANTSGQGNVFNGYYSGSYNSTGSYNVMIGYVAGGYYGVAAGNYNTYLGTYADGNTAGLTNSAAIGYTAIVGCSNCMVLGGTGGNAVNVGIGVTNPLYTLHVEDPAAGAYVLYGKNSYVGNSDGRAIYGSSVNNPGFGYGGYFSGGYMGIYAFANATTYSSSAYGVYAVSTGTTGTRYGVYASASGGTTNYGVYCGGNGAYTGSWSNVSDRRLKRDIRPLDSVLPKIMLLKPSTYFYKTDEYKKMALSEGKHNGLIAQEVEEIFPEVVTENTHPGLTENEKDTISQPIEYKGIDYIKLVPILVKAIQEQQVQIQDLKSEIELLKKK